MTPQDIEFNKAVAALATHRDRHISVTRLVNGGTQFLGFERLSWNSLQPLLAQYTKRGTIATHGTQMALRVEDEIRVDEPELLADTEAIGPAQNLIPLPSDSVQTPSVNLFRYTFIEPTAGVSTKTLAAIAALPACINIKVDRRGVSVLTATQNDFATGLYHTIRQWKKAPHLRQLSSRPFSRSMKRRHPGRVPRRGLRRFRS